MNYIQPNIDMNAAIPANLVQTKPIEKNESDSVSFADALEVAYREKKDESQKTENPSSAAVKKNSTEVEPTEENADEFSKNKDLKVADAKSGEKRSQSDKKKISSDKKIDVKNADKKISKKSADDSEKVEEKIAFNFVDAENKKIDFEQNAVSENLIDVEDVETVEIAQNGFVPQIKAKSEDFSQEDAIEDVELPDLNFENADDFVAENVVSSKNIAKVDFAEKIESNFEKNDDSAEIQNAPKLAVHDLRTQKTKTSKTVAEKKPSEKKSTQSVSQNRPFQKIRGEELRVAYQKDATQADDQQITLELSARSGAEQNIMSSSSQAAAANGSDFQQMLSNTVQQNAAEFVKAGNIVLKDGNSGTINLILRPESLGNVKISLSLSDKVVSGQITVASREAFEAFRENIEAIRQAFTESGFDTGSFDLNFSNQQSFAQNDGEDSRSFEQARAAQAERSYGDYVSAESGESEVSYGGDSHSVNIVA